MRVCLTAIRTSGVNISGVTGSTLAASSTQGLRRACQYRRTPDNIFNHAGQHGHVTVDGAFFPAGVHTLPQNSLRSLALSSSFLAPCSLFPAHALCCVISSTLSLSLSLPSLSGFRRRSWSTSRSPGWRLRCSQSATRHPQLSPTPQRKTLPHAPPYRLSRALHGVTSAFQNMPGSVGEYRRALSLAKEQTEKISYDRASRRSTREYPPFPPLSTLSFLVPKAPEGGSCRRGMERSQPSGISTPSAYSLGARQVLHHSCTRFRQQARPRSATPPNRTTTLPLSPAAPHCHRPLSLLFLRLGPHMRRVRLTLYLSPSFVVTHRSLVNVPTRYASPKPSAIWVGLDAVLSFLPFFFFSWVTRRRPPFFESLAAF